MAVTVRPVTSRSDRNRFLDLPYAHPAYVHNPYWIPPLRMDQAKTLNPKKNAFFEHGAIQLFLAENERGETVGRIAAIKNGTHLQKYNDGVGFFGFFECIDDFAVATALFNAAADWLRQQGLTAMRGPANPTMNDVAGLLVDGFNREPMVLMPYNPPYYQDFLLRAGFERAMTMWAYYINRHYLDMTRLDRGVEVVKRRFPNARVRPIDMSRMEQEVDAALDVYSAAWEPNWGNVAYTRAEAQELAKNLKQILIPELFLFVEVDGKPVAFSVSLPNVNQLFRLLPNGRMLPFGFLRVLLGAELAVINELRMPLMGIRPEYQGRGFDVILVHETIRVGLQLGISKHRPGGFRACEMSWVLDVNKPLTNMLDKFGAIKDKQYAMFEMKL